MNNVLTDAIPNQLFHYTDGSGLLGILQTSTLWASDAELMNDSEELRFGANLFLDLIDKRIKANGSSEEIEQLRDEVRIQFLDRTSPNLNPEYFFYLVSFCRKSDLLSMWRGYGADGGFCLEFDKSLLLKSVGSNEQLEADMRAVKYGHDAVKLLEDALDSFLQNGTKDARSFVWDLTRIFAEVKDSAFQEEQECRLIIRAPACFGPKPDIRATNKHLLTYRILNFSRDAIRSVTVGPGTYQAQSVLALKRRQVPDPSGRHQLNIHTSSVPAR